MVQRIDDLKRLDKREVLDYINKNRSLTKVNGVNNGGVIANIEVGWGPYGLAMAQDSKRVYVTNLWDGTISVIDIKTNKVIGNPIVIGELCTNIVMMKNTSRAYAGGEKWPDGWIAAINTITNKVLVNNVFIGIEVEGMAVLPNGTRVYVVTPYNDKVAIINTAVNRPIIPPIEVGAWPRTVVLSPSTSKGYVNNYSDGNISIFNTITNQVIETVPVAGSIWTMAITPNGRFLYITSDSGTVYVMDTRNNSIVKEIVVSDLFLDGIAVSPNGDRVYVSNSIYNQVIEIDTATNEVINPPFEVGDYPTGIVVTKDGRYAYVGNTLSMIVSVLDLKAKRNVVVG